MRPLDAEKQIKQLAGTIDAARCLSKMREFEKAGYPGASFGDGRGSAESPCLVAVTEETDDWRPRAGMPKGRVLGIADQTDRQVRADRLRLEQGLRHAVLALTEVQQIITAWTLPRDRDDEKDAKLGEGGVPCATVACDRWMSGAQDDRPRHIDGAALCERCYRYERRTKKRWSLQLEAAEAS